LLNLISDILDLSKIESGTVTVDAEEILTANLLDTVGRPFRHEAENRQLSFTIEVDPSLGRSIVTDSKRLQQVLKNLLSNAFKFTAEGGVRLSVSAALGGWSAEHPVLNHSPAVVAFEVSDTGIGIPLEKQKLIFEAFQQAENMAAPVSGSPSAASLRACSVARSTCAARPARAARLCSICR
jgi:signal transduction histidine kinase